MKRITFLFLLIVFAGAPSSMGQIRIKITISDAAMECRQDCDDDKEECQDRAHRSYTRCKRVSEEIQCQNDLEFQKSICTDEFSHCMRICGD